MDGNGGHPVPCSYVGTSPYYALPMHHSVADPAWGFGHGLSEGSLIQYRGSEPAFQMDNMSRSYHQSANIGMHSEMVQGEVVKKKRGRPRKNGSDNSMAPASQRGLQGSDGVIGKRKRGRPPGSGRKQKLASIGGWINRSAGTAFTPHILFMQTGENVVSSIVKFACQRPRALCIVSGNGGISSVTIRQPASSDTVVKHEGHYNILSLSGSYLVSEGGSNKRIGGLNIALSGPDGEPFGGVVDSELIAESPIQVFAFSFIYDTSMSTNKDDEQRPLHFEQEDVGKPSSAENYRPIHDLNPATAGNGWASSQPLHLGDAYPDIDLMLG